MTKPVKLTKEHQVLLKWRWNPVYFVKECLKAEPSNQQEEALILLGKFAVAKIKSNTGKTLNDEERILARKIGITIKSGRGTGKDTFLSWVYLWLMFCFQHSLGLVTAPTSHQLRDVLWKEISKWLRPNELLNDFLTWQTERVFNKEYPETWFITARTANIKGSPEEQAETLSGMHAKYMILAADEASGIPAGVFLNLEATLTQEMNFVILISNPTRASGYFFETHNVDKDRWLCLTWNSEESNRVTRDSIDSLANKYGKDSNMYRINVLGDFPLMDSACLIPYDWVINAVDRELIYSSEMPVIRGFDVGGGKDLTVMVERIGPVVTRIETFDSPRMNEVKDWIMKRLSDDEYTRAYIDNIGIGANVHDEIVHNYKFSRVESCDVRQEATDSTCFRLRDELWWKVRTAFENGTISIPNNEELIGELTTIRFDNEDNTKGLTKIESKKKLRERGISSPNIADALCMTFKDDDSIYKTVANKPWIRKVSKPVNWKVI